MCDEINLPAILSQSLKNQTQIVVLLSDVAAGNILLPQSQLGALLVSCSETQAMFAKFLGDYQIQVQKRTEKPRKCG